MNDEGRKIVYQEKQTLRILPTDYMVKIVISTNLAKSGVE